MKPRSLKLSQDLEKSLTTYASARGTSASSVVREALAVYLDIALTGDQGAPLSFSARAADLAGCVCGRADLSINPAHLASYGASVPRPPRTPRGRATRVR